MNPLRLCFIPIHLRLSQLSLYNTQQPSITLSTIKVKPKNQGNLREIVITFARLFIIPVTLRPIRICTARLSCYNFLTHATFSYTQWRYLAIYPINRLNNYMYLMNSIAMDAVCGYPPHHCD